MVRKIWIVACLAVAGMALTPDTAEAGRRRNKKNCCDPCCQPTCCQTSCCNTGCNTCSTCNSCNSCGGMVSAPVATTTAPPPVATK